MQQRMKNPVMVLNDTLQPLLHANAAMEKGGAPDRTVKLIHLRVSQINGCAHCVDMHARELKHLGESDDRLIALAAWRETTFFSDAERAALALAEAATRIADRPEPVSDEVWAAAARHYDERALAALVMQIAFINFWNRINVPIRQMVAR